MLIESLAQKTRLAMMTVFAVIGGCTVICAFTVWYCISLVNEERQQIYVLDGDIPFLAERARLEANFTMRPRRTYSVHQYSSTFARQRLYQMDGRESDVYG